MAPAEPIRDAELTALFRCLEGRRLALAVSGGVDSMVLLHLVARWRTMCGAAIRDDGGTLRRAQSASPVRAPVGMPRARPRFAAEPGWRDGGGDAHRQDRRTLPMAPIVVLTVDHRLRPASREEAAFVAGEAARLGLPHQTLVWERQDAEAGLTAEGARESSRMPGLQARAREARYGLLADVIEAEAWDAFAAGDASVHPLGPARAKRLLVTAHHRDDVIETFLMRLKRGSGLDGLASIRPFDTVRRHATAARAYPSAVEVCRPLLDVPKARVIATAGARDIAWREDPSNQDARFERARLRQGADILSGLGLEAEALARSVRRLGRARDLVEEAVRARIERTGEDAWLSFNGGLFAEVGFGGSRDGAERETGSAALALAERLFRHALEAIGGELWGGELAQIDDILADAMKGALAARTVAGCRVDGRMPAAARTGWRLRIWREAGRKGLPVLTLAPGDGGWWDGRFAISVGERAPGPVEIAALGEAGVALLKSHVPAVLRLPDVPPGALATLPAAWSGGRLRAVPFFAQAHGIVPEALRHEIAAEYQAWLGAEAVPVRAEFRPLTRL